MRNFVRVNKKKKLSKLVATIFPNHFVPVKSTFSSECLTTIDYLVFITISEKKFGVKSKSFSSAFEVIVME